MSHNYYDWNIFIGDVITDIRQERERQHKKWGSQIAHSGFVWGAILGEEVGEVNEAMLETAFGNDGMDHVYGELIQVAAVAVAWAQAIKRGGALVKMPKETA